MATIEKRGDVWRAKIRVVIGGVVESRSGTFETRREAQRWASAEESAIRGGRSRRSDSNLTVERMLDGWLSDWLAAHPQRREADARRMRQIVSWWAGKLGHRPADKVSRAEIRQALRELRGGDSPSGKSVTASTSNRYAAWISAAFAWGIEEGWCQTNPAAGCKLEEGDGRIRYLSSAAIGGGGGGELELERLLQAVAEVAAMGIDRRPGKAGKVLGPGWRLELAVHLALSTGARQGEIMALRWSWIDLQRAQITLPDTKSGSARTVPVAGRALQLLAARRALAGSAARFRPSDDRVFGSWGFPRRMWYAALDKAGVNIRFHDLRHTAATYLTAAGVPEQVVRQILGHKSATMTKRYAHAAPSAMTEAAEKLAGLLGG